MMHLLFLKKNLNFYLPLGVMLGSSFPGVTFDQQLGQGISIPISALILLCHFGKQTAHFTQNDHDLISC